MLNRVEVKVTRELLANSPIADEYLFRELAKKMVSEMPASELNKLIKFTKTDPDSKDVLDKIHDFRTSDAERHRLMMLQRDQVVLYEAEVSNTAIDVCKLIVAAYEQDGMEGMRVRDELFYKNAMKVLELHTYNPILGQ